MRFNGSISRQRVIRQNCITRSRSVSKRPRCSAMRGIAGREAFSPLSIGSDCRSVLISGSTYCWIFPHPSLRALGRTSFPALVCRSSRSNFRRSGASRHRARFDGVTPPTSRATAIAASCTRKLCPTCCRWNSELRSLRCCPVRAGVKSAVALPLHRSVCAAHPEEWVVEKQVHHGPWSEGRSRDM